MSGGLNTDMPKDCFASEYVSGGCNSVPHCMDWGSNGLLSYGASNSVLIYKPQADGGGRIIDTLVGHKDRVNCVKWIRDGKGSPESELVTASSDKTAIVWLQTKEGFVPTAVLKGHTDSVNTLSSIHLDTGPDQSGYTIVVTSSADSNVMIWKRNCPSRTFELIHTISIRDRGFCFCAQILILPNTQSPLLILSLDDKSGKLVLYSIGETVANLTTLSGHEDWIRDVDYIRLSNKDTLLATASQDSTVRLWRFSEHKEEPKGHKLSLKPILVEIDGTKVHITLESILRGHEDRVCGLQWSSREASCEELRLMSCSLDRTIIEWSPDSETGVWLEKVRLGEMGGDSLGFLGAKYGPSNDSIIAYTHHSAFHKWTKVSDKWESGVALSGHNQGVTDIAWEKNGKYLLSTSLDQTTRLHAVWKKCSLEKSWHEMSRPQIHGYAMNAISALPDFTFVSAADEKVARVFKAPQNVLENLNHLCDLRLELGGGDLQPSGASVPALGLSNKAVYTDINKSDEESFTPQALKEPPTEETLVQNTLWPEIMKLYGHGNQVYSLATSHDGKLLASASKATSRSDATIIIWDTSTWEKLQNLEAHNLTVTKMEFSPDDTQLVTVSRDRTWALFEKQDNKFILKTTIPKGFHSRIIWDCAWTWDSKYFGTCSRDNLICTWTNSGGNSGSLRHPQNQPVTTLDFPSMDTFGNNYLLASGCENGTIDLLIFKPDLNELQLIRTIGNFHVSTVTRLRFKPQMEEDTLLLASSSSDHLVRITSIKIGSLKKTLEK